MEIYEISRDSDKSIFDIYKSVIVGDNGHIALGNAAPLSVTGTVKIEEVDKDEIKACSVTSYIGYLGHTLKISIYKDVCGKKVLAGQVFSPVSGITEMDIEKALNFSFIASKVQGRISALKNTEVVIGVDDDKEVSFYRYDLHSKDVYPMERVPKYSHMNYNYIGASAFPVFIYTHSGKEMVKDIKVFINGKKIDELANFADIDYPNNMTATDKQSMLTGSCIALYRLACEKEGKDEKIVCRNAYDKYYKDNPKLEVTDPYTPFPWSMANINKWADAIGAELKRREDMIVEDCSAAYAKGYNIAVIQSLTNELVEVAQFMDDGSDYSVIPISVDTIQKIYKAVPAYGEVLFENTSSGLDIRTYAIKKGSNPVFLEDSLCDSDTAYLSKAITAGFVASALEKLDTDDAEIILGAIQLNDSLKTREVIGVNSLDIYSFDNNLRITTGTSPQEISTTIKRMQVEFERDEREP